MFHLSKIHQPDLSAIFGDEAIPPFTENFGYHLAYAETSRVKQERPWLLGKGLAGFIHSWYFGDTTSMFKVRQLAVRFQKKSF